MTTSTSTEALEATYGEFADEARALNPAYSPKTVCTDGWEATQNAWQRLFPGICIILCFLHAVLKIGERCVRNLPLRTSLVSKAWSVYEAVTRAPFSQRLRRFREWGVKHKSLGPLRDAVRVFAISENYEPRNPVESVILVGLVKKNGIMMVDFALGLQRKKGLPAEQAIVEASLVRFQPIMMTTLAAILATLPIALGYGAGGETRPPLGIAVVGGLLFSQLFTLYLTPTFYVSLERFTQWLRRGPARYPQRA